MAVVAHADRAGNTGDVPRSCVVGIGLAVDDDLERAEPPGRPEPILELPIGPAWDWAATFRVAGHRRQVFNGSSATILPIKPRSAQDSTAAILPCLLRSLRSLAILDVHMERDELSLGEERRPVLAGSDGARQDQEWNRIEHR